MIVFLTKIKFSLFLEEYSPRQIPDKKMSCLYHAEIQIVIKFFLAINSNGVPNNDK